MGFNKLKFPLLFSLIFSAFLFVSPVYAVNITYNNPVWGDIDQENPPEEPVTHSLDTDIGFNGGEALLTAYHFCDSLGYSYVTHLSDGTVNPSVIWNNDRWEDAQNKDDFLQIVCDDGTVSTSSVPDIIVDVVVPDYTDLFEYLLIIVSSVFFGLVVVYSSSLVRKFV
jgi:hypothetical protein